MRYLTPNRFWLLLAGVMAALPWVYPSDVYRHLLIVVAYHAILALALNLVTGLTGQLSFGHSGFVAAGAYTWALLAVNYNVSFWVGLPAAALVAFMLGIVVGLPSMRVKGIYLGMVTWGLAEVVRLVALNVDFTRGPMGIPGIPAITVLGKPLFALWQVYYVAAFMLFVVLVGSTRLMESRIGDALLAIREDELAAGAMGINTGYLKVLIFGVSAAVAGMAGAFWASYLTFINPSAFTFDLSILMLMFCVLGGLGSIPGALLGAIVLTLVPEVFRVLADYRLWFYGLVLIIMMIYRPEGLVGSHRHLLQSLFVPKPAKGGETDAAQGS